jgi:HSP20 family protein
MNTLRIFTPGGVFKTLSDNVFDHFLFNRDDEPDYAEVYSRGPHTNIVEENDKFRIEIALPGYSKEQISMNIHKDILNINANIGEISMDGKKFLTHEFGLKNFNRRFTIPQTLDADNVNAEFTNGVLSVTVPKKEEVREKEPIEVQIN